MSWLLALLLALPATRDLRSEADRALDPLRGPTLAVEASVLDARWEGDVVRVAVDLVSPVVDERLIHEVVEALLEVWADDRPRGVYVEALDPVTGELLPLPALLPPITPPPEKLVSPLSPPIGVTAPGQPAGFLAGKVVYVSQAHGFTWTQALNRWATQRGNTNGIVEDLVNAEGINHYLVHYLRNAGATVFTVREHDMQHQMAVVDNDGGGTFEEVGEWFDSTLPGFAAGMAPYEGQENPHALGGNRLATTVSGSATAVARWVPDIPAPGHYNVYVTYSQHTARAQDAHYVVRHPGGESHVRLNQERHGGTWVFIGRHWFEAGEDAVIGAVELHNDSELEPGDNVSADAVRFGGGLGDVARGTGSGVATSPTSGRPRWEECARYNVQFQGAPPSVYDYSASDPNDDVSSRSRYAAWQNEAGEDAVYVAWHTNAPNPGVGTSSYIYGPNEPNGQYIFTGTEGSDVLQDVLHAEIINDLRAAFDPAWKDRGKNTAWFGEVNPSHNPEMPAVLVELAFHATASDAEWLKEPRFRQVAARAFYQGVAKYFGARDGVAAPLLPEPPRALRVENLGDGRLRVRWAPPETDSVGLAGEAATGYRVYRSRDGLAFDGGTQVGATELVLDDAPLGEPLYLRVTATNAGGESFPTPVGGATPTCGPRALVVDGFTRIDKHGLIPEYLGPWDLGTVQRFDQSRLNAFDYVRHHGEALFAAGVAFDSAQAEAVESGAVKLADYDLVVWYLGEESTADHTFTEAEQDAVRSYVEAGGRLLVSGAEIAWDLGEKGSAEDQAFLADVLGVTYEADSAGTYATFGVGPLAGLGAISFDDGSQGTYDVGYADVLTPAGGITALEYDAGGAAAVLSGTVLTLGFPFEAVTPGAARIALMQAATETLGASLDAGCAVTPPEDAGPTGDAGTGQAGDAATHADGVGDSDSGAANDSGVGETDSAVAEPQDPLDAGPVGRWKDVAWGGTDTSDVQDAATVVDGDSGQAPPPLGLTDGGCGGCGTGGGPVPGALGVLLAVGLGLRRRAAARQVVQARAS